MSEQSNPNDQVRITPAQGGGGRLRSAFLISTTGDWIYRFAVPTLIFKVTGSALSTAFAYVLEFIPFIVVGLFAGVAADRWDRRRIMVSCDTSSFALAVVIAGVSAQHRPSLAALYTCAFLLACVRPFYFPAFQGFLVETVPEHKLSRINSWTQTVESSLSLAGPVVGTAIVAAAGVPLATLIDAFSFAASAILIYQISRAPRSSTAPGRRGGPFAGVGRDLMDGLRLLWGIRAIRYGSGLMAVANLASFIVEGNLVYLVLRVEHLPKVAIGLVFGAQGLGALIGAILAPHLVDRYPAGRLLVCGMGGSAAAMLLPALEPSWWTVVAGWGTEGIATSIIIVSWFTARQLIVPPDAIGRVVSVSRAAAYATIPLGALVGGWLAAGHGPVRAVFGWAAAVQAAVFLGTALSPVARMGTTEAAADQPGPPASAPPIPAHADPVTSTDPVG